MKRIIFCLLLFFRLQIYKALTAICSQATSYVLISCKAIAWAIIGPHFLIQRSVFFFQFEAFFSSSIFLLKLSNYLNY